MDSTQNKTLEYFVKVALEGTSEIWHVITPESRDTITYWLSGKIATSHICWATVPGLLDTRRTVRELAATFLHESEAFIEHVDQISLVERMLKDEYHVVRYRLAVALYKRGNREPEVLQMMRGAASDPFVGDLAKRYLEREA